MVSFRGKIRFLADELEKLDKTVVLRLKELEELRNFLSEGNNEEKFRYMSENNYNGKENLYENNTYSRYSS